MLTPLLSIDTRRGLWRRGGEDRQLVDRLHALTGEVASYDAGTRAERYDILHSIVEAERPIMCRGVYYRTLGVAASDENVLGVKGSNRAVKGDKWCSTVERDLTKMRRSGRIPHHWIIESGRQSLRSGTWASAGQLIATYAPGFRRELWGDVDEYVEIWAEADSMTGVLRPVTYELDVELRPAKGFSSETLAYSAAQAINRVDKPAFIYQVGDFDPYGVEAWQAIQDRLNELVEVPVHFERIAATVEHRDRFIDLTHPAKIPKNNNKSALTRMRKHTDAYGDRVLEVDAVPTPELRQLTRDAIMRHITSPRFTPSRPRTVSCWRG